MPTPNPDPRRERIATAALAGILACPKTMGTRAELARDAVRCADALIAELDRNVRDPATARVREENQDGRE